MIQILYQNNKTGAAHDISELVKSPKWSTKRNGSPAQFEFEVLADPSISWQHGGIIAVKNDGAGLFYGYVFKISTASTGLISIMAYDQLRYLKNKDTYVFKGKRADQIASAIAADFSLKVGALENTKYVLPSLIMDGKPLIDTILKALDLTLINTGEMYYLWDDYGSIRISACKTSTISTVLGDESLAIDYTYNSEIDSDTFNKVKMVKDNKKTGKRDAYLFQDSGNIKFWGTLQHYEKVAEDLNAAQISEKAMRLLALKNRPMNSFEVKALSDLNVRAGRAIFTSFSDLGFKQFFVVDEVSHDLAKETMSVKLRVI